MSHENQPLTHAEDIALNDFIRNLGWETTTRIQDEFRYSLASDKVCCFCVKKRVLLPVPTFKPWDVVSLKFAFAFQLRFPGEDTFNLLNFVATNLRNVATQAQLDHDFFIQGIEGKLIKALDMLIPDGSTDDLEQTYANLIRVNLLNKYLAYPELNQAIMKDLPAIAEQSRLHPTLAMPWELHDGIPQFRHENTLFFTNDDGDEYLIVEPGYFTFFHDMQVNRVLIRSSFESHSAYVLLSLWKDMDFKIADLVTAWVQFSRQQLANLTSIVEFQDFDKNLLQDVNLERRLLEKGTDTVFPLSSLAQDSRMNSNVTTIPIKYFSKPPMSFDELEAVRAYEQSVQLKRKGKFKEAVDQGIVALKNFNRFAQKQGVVLTLINLSDVAKKTQKYPEAEKYLKDALEMCKSGEVEDDLIIHLQELLGLLKIQVGPAADAVTHLETAIHFLEETTNIEEQKKKSKIAKLRLKLARSYLLADNPAQAKLELKEAIQYAKESIGDPDANAEFMVQYYFEMAFFAEKRENYSQVVISLRKAAALDEKVSNKQLMVQVFIELARVVLTYRKNSAYSLKMLQRAEEILIEKKGENTPRLIKVYELKSDAYALLKDKESEHNYRKQAADLRRALQIRAAHEE